MNFSFRFWTLLGLLFLGLAGAGRAAEDLSTVKSRMTQRLSKLDSLKASGAIGEDSHGLVAVRQEGGEAASVVAAENSDRSEVYAAIAKQTGSTPDAVGRARAKQIAAASAHGIWLQHDDGTWYKK